MLLSASLHLLYVLINAETCAGEWMSDRGMGAPEQKQTAAVYTKHTEIKILPGGGLEVKH